MTDNTMREAIGRTILQALLPQEERRFVPVQGWPEITEYRNSETGKYYKPHSEAELAWVTDTDHKNLWALGGEGGGKTVAGIIRDLERVKRGCQGVITGPDFEHFKRSTWPELRRWIPWEFVIDHHRRMASISWQPSRPFSVIFRTGGQFLCGGMKESDVQSWEGPNVNFWHFDEIRRHGSDAAVKVIQGRVRIPGPNGEPAQVWYTTTPLPQGSWMWKYTGPIPEEKERREKDARLSYKLDRLIVELPTRDNLHNLEATFWEDRASVLSEAEIELLLRGEQVEVAASQSLLPSIVLWDRLKEDLPPLTPETELVVALDAAKGREDAPSDCFGLIAVSRHPQRDNDVAVRYAQKWQADPGKVIDYNADGGPIPTLRDLCERHSVVTVVYDPTELHQPMLDFNKEGLTWVQEFSQRSRRLVADRQLLDLILQKRLAHDGNPDLREHILNAGRKLDSDGHRLRIVQKEADLKVDLAVALSMAAHENLRLNL